MENTATYANVLERLNLLLGRILGLLPAAAAAGYVPIFLNYKKARDRCTAGQHATLISFCIVCAPSDLRHFISSGVRSNEEKPHRKT